VPINTAAVKRTPSQTAAPARSYYDYSKVLLRPTQQVFQLTSLKSFVDDRFGNERYGNVKLRINFVLVLPGWQRASTQAEQDALRLKGHAKPFSLEFNPVCSPPGINAKTKESTKPSGLYEFLRIVINDGDPLTDEQLGRDLVPARGNPSKEQKEALSEWMALFNAALTSKEALAAFNETYPYGLVANREGVIEETPVEDLADAMVRYPAFRLAQMLNKLEQTKVQVYATPTVKVNTRGEKYNKLTGVTSVVPDDERLETYRPFARPKDPREEADNPEVVCSVTGEAIRGWEGREGWLTNEDWAAKQVEVLGEGFRLEYNGKFYLPPFSPRFYSMAREQAKGSEDLPF
jgi:hypothetical protein